VDQDFFELFDIQFTEGRNFIKTSEQDKKTGYIINESAAKIIRNKKLQKKKNIIGYPFRLWDRDEMGKIIGVVEDYHFKSLHHNIGPLVMYHRPKWSHILFVKVKGNKLESTIDHIKNTSENLLKNYTFNYRFVDESFNRMYQKEQRYGKLFGYFAILAIFIASLGLFGLALFSTSQRMKEISIRKVFGSRSKQVILLLVKDFSKWVIIANLIGWPVAYLFMQKWLQNFAYKTSISWIVFLTALIISLLIALVTVIFQANHAANTNPADVLRDE
jgi:putative ABC transport system permease protein